MTNALAPVVSAVVPVANPFSSVSGTLLPITSVRSAAPTVGPITEEVIAKVALQTVADKLFEKQQYGEATELYRKVLRNRPGYTPVRLNYAASLLRQGKWDEAKASYDAAKHDVSGLMNLGLMEMYEGNREAARQCIDKAVAMDPSNPSHHHDKACFHLFFEEWKEGWDEYEWRWMTDQATWRPDPVYEWRGDQSIPSVLLLTEQGFGDNIHFARYIRHVQPRKLMICKDPWKPILGAIEGVDETPGVGTACAFTSLMSLPRLTGRYEPFWPGPYLHAKVPINHGPAFNVGVCWKGNPNHKHDSWRSANPRDFAPLYSIPGVNIVSLQVPGNATLRTYDDTMNAIAGLDLVVTIDTSVLHLAAAMGKPTWGLIAKIPDWRWQFGRADSPWYPTLRLYRQSRLCDWKEPMERVVNDVREKVRALQRTERP